MLFLHILLHDIFPSDSLFHDIFKSNITAVLNCRDTQNISHRSVNMQYATIDYQLLY